MRFKVQRAEAGWVVYEAMDTEVARCLDENSALCFVQAQLVGANADEKHALAMDFSRSEQWQR
jgi:hypothetical protein